VLIAAQPEKNHREVSRSYVAFGRVFILVLEADWRAYGAEGEYDIDDPSDILRNSWMFGQAVPHTSA